MWIYGICDRPELPPPPGLEALGDGELVTVFSRHGQGDPTPAALWAHERVVERLMADRTVVPGRFGSTVAGEDGLRRRLDERREPLAAAIARVRGRVELGVRVLAQARAAPGSGRDYLLARLEESRRAAARHEPLAELAADATRQPSRGGELLRGAYLVDRAGVAGFRDAVGDLQDEHPELTILCTGPWPAYSFVG